MSVQRIIERDILAVGRIDGHELVLLRRHVYGSGAIDRPKADFLVELHRRVQHHTPAFEHFYYQAIKDYVLRDGRIEAREAAWLRQALSTGRWMKDEERKLLHELKGEARKVCREFDALFAECMRQPQERHTCG